MTMIKRDRQPLLGCTIIETQTISREPVTCECCGKVMKWEPITLPPGTRAELPASFDMSNACFDVRVFHWGDDNTDTTEDNFRLCPSCFRSDSKFIPFVLSKGFTIHPECAKKYSRFTHHLMKNPAFVPPQE